MSDEPPAELAQNRIARVLPLLDVKDEIRIVHLQVFTHSQRFSPQDLFKRSARSVPNFLAFVEQVQRTSHDRSQHSFRRSESSMEVDLAKHVVARLQVFFDCINAARLHVNSIGSLVDCESIDDPLEIVDSILRPGHQRVAQQVVHAIDVELR